VLQFALLKMQNHTIPQDKIDETLRDFDRRKKDNSQRNEANTFREISSAIGSETPISVLFDIRELLSDILKQHIEVNARLQEQAEISNRQYSEMMERMNDMHLEKIAYMDQIANVKSMQTSSSVLGQVSNLSVSHAQMSQTNQQYYYRGDELKTTDSVIGCIFMHLDYLVARVLPETVPDTVPMEVSDWSTAIRILKDAESIRTSITGKLSLPKRSSNEVEYALNIIATITKGRTPQCNIDQIYDLTIKCPSLMGCVEEIRQRSIRCPGIISPVRNRRLNTISYPYVVDGVLNSLQTLADPIGSLVVNDGVKTMKIAARKEYCSLILRDKIAPVKAMLLVKGTKNNN
jgi:hypothetical protein